MNLEKFLAALITLLNPTASDDQIRSAVSVALARGELLYATPVREPRGRTVSDEALASRILEFLGTCPYHPSMREILAKVPGNRHKVHAVAKTMMRNEILYAVRSGRSVGIKVK